MSNRTIPPPFISEPPIYNEFLDDEGVMTPAWVNWINSITRVMGYTLVHDYLIDPVTKERNEETPLLQAISLIAAQALPDKELGRDDLENARDGTILYNSTTNRFNFRENGLWKTFTPIAA